MPHGILETISDNIGGGSSSALTSIYEVIESVLSIKCFLCKILLCIAHYMLKFIKLNTRSVFSYFKCKLAASVERVKLLLIKLNNSVISLCLLLLYKAKNPSRLLFFSSFLLRLSLLLWLDSEEFSKTSSKTLSCFSNFLKVLLLLFCPACNFLKSIINLGNAFVCLDGISSVKSDSGTSKCTSELTKIVRVEFYSIPI